MKNYCVKIILLIVSLIGFSSCDTEQLRSADPLDEEQYRTILFPVTVNGSVITTKSSYASESSKSSFETTIKNICLLAYDESGNLGAFHYGTDVSAVKLSLRVGRNYDFYAVANVGDLSASLITKAQAELYECDWQQCLSTTGMPFSYKSESSVSINANGISSMTLDMQRMLARYEFSIDTGALSPGKFSVTGLRLRNVPKTVMAFTKNKLKQASDAVDGDSATTADLSSINTSGGYMTIYVPENIQGTLLPGNTDPAQKSADNAKLAAYASLCTYLELVGNYENKGLSTTGSTYRMYLGANATDNFDVIRNVSSPLRFSFSYSGMFQDTWKADISSVSDSRTLSFSKSSAVVKYGTDQTLTVSLSDSFDYTVSADAAFTSAGFSFIRTGNTITVKAGKKYSSDVSGTLTAVSWDGRKKAICTISQKPEVTTSRELMLNGSALTVSKGLEVAIPQSGTLVTHTFYDGVEQTSLKSTSNVTVTSFTSQNTTVATVSGTKVKGIASGASTYLRGTYDGVVSAWSLKVSITNAVEVSKTKVEGEDVTYKETNSDYKAYVTLSKNSTVAAPGKVTITASADHRYVKIKHTAYKYRYKHNYSDGSVVEDASWTYPDPARADKDETVSDTRVADTYDISSDASWLSTSGIIQKNTVPSIRTATITVRNTGTTGVTAQASIWQEANVIAGLWVTADKTLIEKNEQTSISAKADFSNGDSGVAIPASELALSITFGAEYLGIGTGTARVVGLASGEGIVRGTYYYGGRKIVCDVRIKVYEMSSLSLNATKFDVLKSSLYYLSATAHYTNGAPDKDVSDLCTWTSSNTTVARVSNKGTVSGQNVASNSVTISASYTSGGVTKTASCQGSFYNDYYLTEISWREVTGSFEVEPRFFGYTADASVLSRAETDIKNAYWIVEANNGLYREFSNAVSAYLTARNNRPARVTVMVTTNVTKYGDTKTFQYTQDF